MTKSRQARRAAAALVAGALALGLGLGCGGGGSGRTDGGACPSGQLLCDGVCTNPQLDPRHCGSCDTSCPAGEVCARGACAVACPAGLSDCGGACTATASDPRHCGGCTTACAAGQVCADGACAASCPPGFTDCGGACADTLLDPQHCGNCTTACNSGETCVIGACMLLCPAGQTNCSGTCTNTAIDPRHCGTCPNSCAAGEVCLGGACATFCPAGTTWCDGACADLTRDADHCGDCGTACGATLACHAGRCSAPRGTGLVDSWGELWDGFARPAATWADAQAACTAVGGRLPTVTELYRVNATSGTGELSDITATALLWSQVPWTTTTAAAARLSDGLVSPVAMTALLAYRCVWPDATDAFFGANACHGPPGATCSSAAGSPGYNVDAWDRPAVTYLAAAIECGRLHAHLPQQLELAEAVTGSPALGDGGNAVVWTADQSHATIVQGVRWTGAEPTTYTDVAPDVTRLAKTGTARFRCLGVGVDPGPHPATISGEFVAPTTRLKGESADRAASTLHEAASACFAEGGHLPLARDLVELIQAGLPAGSGVPVWTADAASYLHNAVLTWTGTAPYFSGSTAAEGASSLRGAVTHPFRCVYLPVDAAVTAPAGCNGGCFAATNGPVTTWTDTFDRTPLGYVEAATACVGVGGHLASFRDLLELVRAGLPNGSAQLLWTSDAAGGDIVTLPENYTLMAKWTAEATGFDGTTPTYVTHSSRASPATAPFRCVWSNEYR